ncbi:MAG: hypothetical protein AMXMBFR56_76970 [Polyangiaceae bacterium]
MASNYFDFIEGLVRARWARGHYGQRLLGVLISLNANRIADAFSQAVTAPLLTPDQPADALGQSGEDRGMPRYPAESDAQYRARLQGAWAYWKAVANRFAMQVQIGLAGFVGTTVYTPNRIHPVTGNAAGEWTRPPFTHPVSGNPWWSQFWIWLPKTAWTPAPTPICGTPGATAGSGLSCGTGATQSVVATLRGLARRRAAHIICQDIILEYEAPTCGTGVTSGSGALCGGSTQHITP